MSRSNGSQIKWTFYSAAFMLFFFLETCVFNRFPIRGAVPVLAPVVVAMAALFEGSLTGSIYGMMIGLYCAIVYHRSGIFLIPSCTLIGMFVGTTTNKQIGRTLLGGILCSLFAIVFSEGFFVSLRFLFYRDSMDTLLRIALPEAGYSALFILPAYFVFRAIYRKYRTDAKL